MTISTPALVMTSSGPSAPAYADILDWLKSQYRGIYGSDVYLESDSQDGQWLAVLASAFNDCNAGALAVYNSFSPATAQGNSLSSNVKLNGLTRQVATNSTATVTVVGVAGTAITNGIVQDDAKIKWNLPATVNIPASGQVQVTATCQQAGAVNAVPGSISTIITPQLGWQSVANPTAAVPGAPVESDAALRQRQASSVAMQAQTTLASIVGAVAAVSGVTRCTAYENLTGAVDSYGFPSGAIAIITEGGDALSIATAIANKKTVGPPTAGSSSQVVQDQYGISRTIKFSPVAQQRISVAVSLHPINGYTAAIGTKVQNAIANYINGLRINGNVFLMRLVNPANLSSFVLESSGVTVAADADGQTYELMSVAASIYPNAPVAADVQIGFGQVAHCDPNDVVITLV